MRHIDTIVLVKDIAASRAFYTEVLGLEILHDWQTMVVFHNRLALHQLDLLQPQELVAPFLAPQAIGAGNLIVYVATDRLDEEFARLQGLGVEVVHGIVTLPWQRLFRIRDVDGYLVEVGEELE